MREMGKRHWSRVGCVIHVPADFQNPWWAPNTKADGRSGGSTMRCRQRRHVNATRSPRHPGFPRGLESGRQCFINGLVELRIVIREGKGKGGRGACFREDARGILLLRLVTILVKTEIFVIEPSSQSAELLLQPWIARSTSSQRIERCVNIVASETDDRDYHLAGGEGCTSPLRWRSLAKRVCHPGCFRIQPPLLVHHGTTFRGVTGRAPAPRNGRCAVRADRPRCAYLQEAKSLLLRVVYDVGFGVAHTRGQRLARRQRHARTQVAAGFTRSNQDTLSTVRIFGEANPHRNAPRLRRWNCVRERSESCAPPRLPQPPPVRSPRRAHSLQGSGGPHPRRRGGQAPRDSNRGTSARPAWRQARRRWRPVRRRRGSPRSRNPRC